MEDLVKEYIGQIIPRKVYWDENQAVFLATLELGVPRAMLLEYAERKGIGGELPDPAYFWTDVGLAYALEKKVKREGVGTCVERGGLGLLDALLFLETLDFLEVGGEYRTEEGELIELLIQEVGEDFD